MISIVFVCSSFLKLGLVSLHRSSSQILKKKFRFSDIKTRGLYFFQIRWYPCQPSSDEGLVLSKVFKVRFCSLSTIQITNTVDQSIITVESSKIYCTFKTTFSTKFCLDESIRQKLCFVYKSRLELCPKCECFGLRLEIGNLVTLDIIF